jgi:hypothetical protein
MLEVDCSDPNIEKILMAIMLDTTILTCFSGIDITDYYIENHDRILKEFGERP